MSSAIILIIMCGLLRLFTNQKFLSSHLNFLIGNINKSSHVGRVEWFSSTLAQKKVNGYPPVEHESSSREGFFFFLFFLYQYLMQSRSTNTVHQKFMQRLLWLRNPSLPAVHIDKQPWGCMSFYLRKCLICCDVAKRFNIMYFISAILKLKIRLIFSFPRKKKRIE